MGVSGKSLRGPGLNSCCADVSIGSYAKILVYLPAFRRFFLSSCWFRLLLLLPAASLLPFAPAPTLFFQVTDEKPRACE